MKKTTSTVLVLALCMVADVAKADFTFRTPTKVPNVNSTSRDFKPSISADGLSLFFISNRPDGVGVTDIWVTTRETMQDSWGTPMNLGPTINGTGSDAGASISTDGLSLYFVSVRSGGYGGGDIWVTTRDTIYNEWGTPTNLGSTVNSSADDTWPSISGDGLALYFSSNRGDGYGAYDVWVITRETIHDRWGAPENLGPTINSSAYDVDPGISADGRTLFFASDRSDGYGSATDDIWVTSRATTDDLWGEPVNLGSTVNSSEWEDYPNVSADGSTLFFRYSQSGRYSGGDIWQAPIIPIVDFNGDGIVNAADVCIMVDHWGENYSLCDIGPTPFGDGIVDVQDLIVLAEHLFEDVRLVAHWKLDEAEGDIAYDSANSHNATLSGNPVWQDTDGKIDGALEFDGVDDYVSTPSVLDAADGPCSAFAWIKGSAPGQVVFSQTDGTGFGGIWLGLNPSDGKLFTTLMFVELKSESAITDGDWHHLGLVWDGSLRHLYLDGAEVAQDAAALSYALSCDGGLNIGTDKKLSTGSFFSGLIDDVRIYNIALTSEQIAASTQ
jgi:hypothetical protein